MRPRPSAKSLRQRRGQSGEEELGHQAGLRTPSESREADVEAEGVPSPAGEAALEAQSALSGTGGAVGEATLWRRRQWKRARRAPHRRTPLPPLCSLFALHDPAAGPSVQLEAVVEGDALDELQQEQAKLQEPQQPAQQVQPPAVLTTAAAAAEAEGDALEAMMR